MHDVFLGRSSSDFQSMGVPSDWPEADAVAAVVGAWSGDAAPTWVASSSASFAGAVADAFGGVPVQAVPNIQLVT